MSRILRSATRSRLKLAASSSTRFEFNLLGLPEEIICLIVEHVDEVQSLARLSRTCRQCQRLTEIKLYRHHVLRSAYEGDLLRHSLDTRPARESCIHTLAYLMASKTDQSFDCLQDLLARCTHLKEFSFESPECNRSHFEDEDAWTDMTDHLFQPFQDSQDVSLELGMKPLQMLSKLTLHMNGIESPYWNFDARSKNIFLLPALSYLKISCVNILDNLSEGINRVSFSPLKHLELEECNFTHQGLHHLLSFPKALEHFELLENRYNVVHFGAPVHPSWNQLFKNNPAATLAALSQQKHSLTSLTYATSEDDHWRVGPTLVTPEKTPVDAGFSDFLALEEVKLIGECALFERAVLSSRAPPNLKILAADSEDPLRRFSYDFQRPDEDPEHPLDFAPFFRAPSSRMPKSLERLELTLEDDPDESRALILDLAKELGAVGVMLTVSFKESNNYFPPYLDGEHRPEEYLYFDGDIIVL